MQRYLIEHLSNPGKFLDCAKRHLRRKGYLLLTTPNARHPQLWLVQKFNPNHVQLYSLKILRNLLKRHGFEIVSSCPLRGKYTTLGGKIYGNFIRIFSPSLYFGVVAKPKN